MSGTITVADPAENSQLELSGHIKPNHQFLSGLKADELANFFSGTKATDAGFAFRLSGPGTAAQFLMK
jgi:hypothetical protein